MRSGWIFTSLTVQKKGERKKRGIAYKSTDAIHLNMHDTVNALYNNL